MERTEGNDSARRASGEVMLSLHSCKATIHPGEVGDILRVRPKRMIAKHSYQTEVHGFSDVEKIPFFLRVSSGKKSHTISHTILTPKSSSFTAF